MLFFATTINYMDRQILSLLKPILEAYVKRFLTPGEFYHPAGYFPDQGCFDTGFNGLTLALFVLAIPLPFVVVGHALAILTSRRLEATA